MPDTVEPVVAAVPTETPTPPVAAATAPNPLDDFDFSSFANDEGVPTSELVAAVKEAIEPPAPATTPVETAKPPVEPPVEPTAPAVAAPVVAVAEPAKPVLPAHPPSLIQAAKALGIQEHHIAHTPTDALFDWVFRLQGAVQQKPAETKPVVVDEQEARIKRLEEEGLTPPDIIAAMRHEHTENVALKNELTQIRGHLQAEADEKSNAMIDQAFDALPAEFQKVFGKGRLATLPRAAQEARHKRALEIGFGKEGPAGFQARLEAWASEIKALAGAITQPTEPATNGASKKQVEKPKDKFTVAEFEEGALAAAVAAGGPLSERDKTLLQIAKDRFKEWGIDGRDEPKQELPGIPD